MAYEHRKKNAHLLSGALIAFNLSVAAGVAFNLAQNSVKLDFNNGTATDLCIQQAIRDGVVNLSLPKRDITKPYIYVGEIPPKDLPQDAVQTCETLYASNASPQWKKIGL